MKKFTWLAWVVGWLTFGAPAVRAQAGDPCYYEMVGPGLAAVSEPGVDEIRAGTLLGIGGSAHGTVVQGEKIELYRYRGRLFVIYEIESGYEFVGSVRHRKFERRIYSDIRRVWVKGTPVIYSADGMFMLAYGFEFHAHFLDCDLPNYLPPGAVEQWQAFVNLQRYAPGDPRGVRHGTVAFAETRAGHFLTDHPERVHSHGIGDEWKVFRAALPRRLFGATGLARD